MNRQTETPIAGSRHLLSADAIFSRYFPTLVLLQLPTYGACLPATHSDDLSNPFCLLYYPIKICAAFAILCYMYVLFGPQPSVMRRPATTRSVTQYVRKSLETASEQLSILQGCPKKPSPLERVFLRFLFKDVLCRH